MAQIQIQTGLHTCTRQWHLHSVLCAAADQSENLPHIKDVMVPQHTAFTASPARFFFFSLLPTLLLFLHIAGKLELVSCVFKVPVLLLLFSQIAPLPALLIVSSWESGKTLLPTVISHQGISVFLQRGKFCLMATLKQR